MALGPSHHLAMLTERRSPTSALAEPDAARYIGYTPSSLRAWRREGRGPAFVRHGRSVRYLTSDLDSWLAAHRVQPGNDDARQAGCRLIGTPVAGFPRG